LGSLKKTPLERSISGSKYAYRGARRSGHDDFSDKSGGKVKRVAANNRRGLNHGEGLK